MRFYIRIINLTIDPWCVHRD
eukprot:COSAG01_NODE_61107_length_291_cov_0.755208_1_plen_20_part_10